MEINKITAILNSEGLKIRTFVLMDSTETAKTFKTSEGIIHKSVLLKPERLAKFYWEVYSDKENARIARDIIKKAIMEEYDALRGELDAIERAITEFQALPKQEIIKIHPEVTKHIEGNATALFKTPNEDDGYYCLPFWYEKMGENEYKVHRLDNLPPELKRKMLMWSDLAHSHPELIPYEAEDN